MYWVLQSLIQIAASLSFKRGPVFSNIVLIDEINRAPAKTQAALFEIMEERQVTMDGTGLFNGTSFYCNCYSKSY